jgi:hypothetical protein
MTTQQRLRRRRHAISILLGLSAVLAALVVVPMVAGAGARDSVTLEKSRTAQASGAPSFKIANLTAAPITVTITDRYSIGGSSKNSGPIVVPANSTVTFNAPADWPFTADWAAGKPGFDDVDNKYFAHFTLNGKATKSSEFCTCGGSAPASTTTSTFRT